MINDDGILRLSFEHSPTVFKAITDDGFVTGLMGPVGSGKSVGGVAWCLKIAMEQEPATRDNIRYTRIGIIRNTTPELKSTTIKTVIDTLPEGTHGRVIFSSPITYHIKRPPNKKTGEPGIDCELLFVALDKPRDVRKLLSLELTAAWGNEARELPKAIIDGLTERVGRYPSKQKGTCTRRQIFLDTNSMDEDHWWYKTFEEGDTTTVVVIDGVEHCFTWNLYKQPPAVFEVKENPGGGYISIEKGHEGLKYNDNEVIVAANRIWGINPKSENLPNLVPGYYHQQMANKTLEHIQCYQQGKYVYVREGRPVIPEYSHDIMCQEFPILQDIPLQLGIDVGGGTLQPSVIFLQKHPRGIWLAQAELVCFNMGVERFIDLLLPFKKDLFGEIPIKVAWLDPAAEKRDELFETKIAAYFRARGIPARQAPTQDPRARIDAIRRPMGRMIDGKPGILIHKTRCKMLDKGLNGAWNMRRLQVVGVEAYADKPSKNEFSHICDALGYGLSGGGEHVVKTNFGADGAQQQGAVGQHNAIIDFNVLG